jgi:hypothetical protein
MNRSQNRTAYYLTKFYSIKYPLQLNTIIKSVNKSKNFKIGKFLFLIYDDGNIESFYRKKIQIQVYK